MIHVSARAIEWLEKAKTFYGNVYVSGHGVAACQLVRITPEIELLTGPTSRLNDKHAGVEDVRALYLKMPYKVVYEPGGDDEVSGFSWVRRPLVVFDCPECRFKFDRACERAAKKTGKWVIESRAGGLGRHFVWTDGKRREPVLTLQTTYAERRRIARYYDAKERNHR